MKRFEGRTVIVTGGGRGIGAAIAMRFVAEGARVSVLDIDAQAAESMAQKMREAGGDALGVRCDITDRAEVDSAIAATEASLGASSVLVNNAGWDVFKPFLATSRDDWNRLIAVNLLGPLNMHHAILPRMVARKSGRVVNIASDAARVGSSGEAVYAACKAGLVAFSKTIAREHARDGITINVVCPGPTDTALLANFKEGAANPDKLMESFRRSIPLGRIGQPEDLPGAVLFFASDDAAYVTGQVLSVSGGLTMSG